jgi:uncharacterized membrane protein YecN with MAPEG domain
VNARRVLFGAGGAVYLFLWALAFAGARNLVPILLVPLVLAVLVGAGNFLNHTLGIKRKAQQFQERDGE